MSTKLNWLKLIEIDELQAENRTRSEKDYDRIIFSQAFRRLARKTQVHPLAINDHVHNRMTHSIEVSAVARSIASKISPDKIGDKKACATTLMAAGLAHDFGNPPFGHIGEDAISRWVQKNDDSLKGIGISKSTRKTYQKYDGNAQNFRIFTATEYFIDKPLSKQTIASIVKCPVESNGITEKSGYFSFNKSEFESSFDALGLMIDGKAVRHPLSFLLEAADDICYAIMDIDDAIEMGIINSENAAMRSAVEDLLGRFSPKTQISEFRSRRGEIIDNAILEIAQTYEDHYDSIMNGGIEFKQDLFKLSTRKTTLDGIIALKSCAKNEVFKNRRKVKIETASYYAIETILDAWKIAYLDFHSNGFKIDGCLMQTKRTFELFEFFGPGGKIEPGINDEGLIKAIDFISGMTDRYAQDRVKVLHGIID